MFSLLVHDQLFDFLKRMQTPARMKSSTQIVITEDSLLSGKNTYRIGPMIRRPSNEALVPFDGLLLSVLCR
jgi:hypothetical protein